MQSPLTAGGPRSWKKSAPVLAYFCNTSPTIAKDVLFFVVEDCDGLFYSYVLVVSHLPCKIEQIESGDEDQHSSREYKEP